MRTLFKYTENFTTKKWKFSDKNSDIFHISAQNIDCGYSFEPFYYIKVGFKGVKIKSVFVMIDKSPKAT